MKHSTKAFRKQRKAVDTEVRKGYKKTFPGTEGKILVKKSDKAAKKQRALFQSMGGTAHSGARPYKAGGRYS